MRLKLFWGLIFLSGGLAAQPATDLLKLTPYFQTILSDTLQEVSGLTIWNGHLYGINDSGNKAELYQISPDKGTVNLTLSADFKNQDWEALASDEDFFYVGDFGNNLGDRKDLAVYQAAISERGDSLLLNKKLEFYYPEQKDFSRRNLNHNFDGEALILRPDGLHVFTKEWKSNAVSHYFLDPDLTEKQAAKKLEETFLGFAVTDAAYFGGKLYLLGYTKGAELYLAIAEETAPGVFFEAPLRRFLLGMATRFGQLEGLAATQEGLYLAGEKFTHFLFSAKQSLYFIPYGDLK